MSEYQNLIDLCHCGFRLNEFEDGVIFAIGRKMVYGAKYQER